MRWLDSLAVWYAIRRAHRHRRWLQRNRVIYTAPKPDDRNWSDNYMKAFRGKE